MRALKTKQGTRAYEMCRFDFQTYRMEENVSVRMKIPETHFCSSLKGNGNDSDRNSLVPIGGNDRYDD